MQHEQFAFVNELNRLAAKEHPEDEQLQARIKSYELALRMQKAVPEVLDLSRETRETQRLYGIDNPTTAIYRVLTRAGWMFRAANAWKSITARPSRRS